MQLFSESPRKALEDSYPQALWKPWLGDKATQKTWSGEEMKRRYLDDLGTRMGVRRFSDFYSLDPSSFKAEFRGGPIPSRPLFLIFSGLKNEFGSLTSLLIATYYEQFWQPWSFSTSPADIWGKEETVARFFGSH